MQNIADTSTYTDDGEKIEKLYYFQRDNVSLAKVVQQNIVKIKGQNFTGVYPSLYMALKHARKHIILLCLYFKLRSFS